MRYAHWGKAVAQLSPMKQLAVPKEKLEFKLEKQTLPPLPNQHTKYIVSETGLTIHF